MDERRQREQDTSCGVAALKALQELLKPQGMEVLAQATSKSSRTETR